MAKPDADARDPVVSHKRADSVCDRLDLVKEVGEMFRWRRRLSQPRAELVPREPAGSVGMITAVPPFLRRQSDQLSQFLA